MIHLIWKQEQKSEIGSDLTSLMFLSEHKVDEYS